MEIKGKVLAKEGAPIEGATVMVVDGPGSWSDMAAITSKTGEFSLDVNEAGVFKVSVFFNNQSKNYSLEPSSKNQEIVFK
ncbi:carboxypeptidase-like regulatory domain-containing protein [Cognataquiflexum rubidum]|uniref:carboxypeptidase-like regulatory domain-containing protein n=1 Tax=Cognataquiflexum rubidum TaxID=2922273 RepID=UPI001F13C3D2|nr:carboxypeptidase-like regulatory domain-containing protein [Cognataquiflexum rubidum]MCH6233434.1 carboxypeptidase-like regulatory domain-containing protein [Cognataquiflexum rubidum]